MIKYHTSTYFDPSINSGESSSVQAAKAALSVKSVNPSKSSGLVLHTTDSHAVRSLVFAHVGIAVGEEEVP
jgi:hypothetical protein